MGVQRFVDVTDSVQCCVMFSIIRFRLLLASYICRCVRCIRTGVAWVIMYVALRFRYSS